MKELENKIVVGYGRVSTTEQKDKGYSLPGQKSSITDFSKEKVMKIDKYFEEDYSAKTFNRPSYKELKKYVLKNKNRIDYILVHSWDRFARDIEGALNQIRYFESIGVEVNSVKNWINFKDPTQFLLLVIYLAMPEAENKVRASKVKEGIRKANLMGRWVNMQPKGYIPGRDETRKVLMKPDITKGVLVTQLFDEYSLGVKPQSEFLTDPKYKDLKLTKSNLSRMLKQIAYTGRILVTAFEKEPEQIVDALHQPLVTIDVFNKVQDIIEGRSRYKQKPKKTNPLFPLRGFLTCYQCGGNLTGSNSGNGRGGKFAYYHCNPKKGCNTRFKIKNVHNALKKYIDKITPSDKILNLLKVILNEQLKLSNYNNKSLIQKNKNTIETLENKQEVLLDTLLNKTINQDIFSKANTKIENEISDLSSEIENLNANEGNTEILINYGLHLFKNLSRFLHFAPINIKIKLLSSIFKEKLIFEGDNYRTPILNKGIEFMLLSTNTLGVNLNKNERHPFGSLSLSTRDGT